MRILGIPMTPVEGKYILIERLLLIASWRVKKLAKYVLWIVQTIKVLSHMAKVTCVQANDLGIRLQSRLLELSAINYIF